MKNHLNAHETSRRLLNVILAASLALPLPAMAAAVALASSPLATSSTTTVMPNVMFVLDDSGSMDWDYMPDDSKNFAGKYGFNSNHCNGVYYNPLITYTPPVYATGTSYPDASFTGAWKSGYNTGLGTVNLDTGFTGGSGSGSSGAGGGYTGPAFYYEYLTATTTPAGPGTQTANWQQDFHNTNSIFYKECISAVGSTTAVDGTNPVNTVFKKVRLASTPTTTISINSSGGGATITVSGNSRTIVSDVTVNGVHILDAATSRSSSSGTVASNIAAGINNCTTTKPSGSLCTIVGGTGFSATVSGSVVTINGPGSAGGFSPVVTNGTCTSPCMSYTYSAFPTIASTYVSGVRVNGVELLLSGSTASSATPATLAASLAASINATGYTATASGSVVTVTGPISASTYTPVITAVPATGGLTLTTDAFPESAPAKLKNFANWYSYYSNRMLMMKTGVGQAFSPIDAKYRVGFMTMNNNVSPDIAEIAPFDATQRSTWYSKLYDATPGNSTPLREALSHVGQMYAHKFGDYDVYTATVTVSGSGSTVVESVSVNEGGAAPVETMAGTAVGSSSTGTVAANIAAQINLKDPSNYGASVSGNVIKITGPATALNSYPVILDDGGGMSFSSTAFVKSTVHAQLNGITPKDPVQYSCQQNFVILSTDGYWNGSTTYDLSTPNQPVGNQDGTAPRAMYDGGLFTKTTTQTSQRQTQLTETHTQLQSRTTQVQSSTSNLQSSTYNLQSTTYPLQSTTANLQSSTYALQNVPSYLQSQTSQLTKQTSTLQGTVSRVLMKCSNTTTNCGTAPATGLPGVGSGTASWALATSCTNGASNASPRCSRITPSPALTRNVDSTCNTSGTINNSSPYTATNTDGGYQYSSCQYTGWSTAVGASACAVVAKSGSSPYTVLTAVQCPTTVTSAWANAVATCTTNATPDVNGYTTACRYNTPSATPSPVGSCTYQTRSGSSPYTVLTENICSYATTSPAVTTVASCTPVAQTTGTANGTVWDATAHSCGYAAYSAVAPAASCTYQNKSAAAPYVGPAVTCSYATTSPTVTTVASCSPVAQTTSTADGTVWDATAHTCAYSATPVVATVASCTDVAQSTSAPYTGPAVACGYTAWGAWANTGSCTPAAQSAVPPYTVAATQCQTTDTGWVGTASCANSGPTSGRTVYCNTPNSPVVLPGYPTPVASCTPQAAGSGNSYVTISCSTATIQGSHLVASCTQGNTGAPDYKQTYCTTTTIATVTNASSCVAGNSGAPSYIQTTCTGGAGGTADTLADVAMYYYQTDIRDTSLANCTGVLGSDVCYNNVFISGADNNVKQHMTTFTLGLGARGRMVYTSKNYMNDTSGDFYSVKLGSATNLTTTPPVCNWQTTGSVCNWPIPSSSSINNIDDLWHAAVNGRGTYFSASDPASLSDGLSSALSSITARKGAAAAAATSTLNPVAGNNFAYVASYTTVKWIGNLEARTIDTTNGVISKNASWCVDNLAADVCAAPSTVVTTINGSSTSFDCVTPNATAATCIWPNVFDPIANTCAVPMALDCVGKLPPMVSGTSDTRKIITANSSGTGFVDFYYANLTATQQSYFNTTTLSGLSQWSTIVSLGKQADAQANIVNYLRGQYGYDDRATNLVSGVDNRLFRSREAVLGDALESQPSFIAAPTFSYADAGYSSFVTSHASRPGTVYMGTNDGMLHAFVANTDATLSPPEVGGTERWAFVPKVVMPNMWHLADTDYSVNHVNYVNGSPVISDIYCSAGALCPGGTSAWRTILVGGLNAGGREYYALDITDPTAPQLLWEFTPTVDANLGYTFGIPVVTKLANGTWVVLVTSGYDNGSLSSNGLTANSPAGDGIGRLYVLDARTGAIIRSYSTGVGTAATPSGLGKISTWNNATESNEAGYTYGGDLLGNVWRFDINASASPGVNPLLFATLKDPSGVAQSITAAPILGMVAGKHVVFVGTGKYLETSDLGNTQKQTLYAIKDDGATATLVNPGGSPRNSLKLVQQTITPNGNVRVGSYNKVDFTTDRGWYVDFPDSGERVNIDGKLVLGTLLVPTIVPASTVCSPGGYGWLNFFDYTNGWPTTDGTGTGTAGTNKNVSVKFDASIVGMNILFINGKPVVEVVTSDNPTPTIPPIPPVFNTGNSTFTGKRMQWRELIP